MDAEDTFQAASVSVETTQPVDVAVGLAPILEPAVDVAIKDSATLMDEIIGIVAPPADTVEVSFGLKTLVFEAIHDRVRLREIQAGSARFAQIKPASVANEADRPYYDTDPNTLAVSYVLAALSVEPKFKPLDFLKLAKCAAVPFEDLVTRVNAGHTRAFVAAEDKQVLDSKNESSETSDSETA